MVNVVFELQLLDSSANCEIVKQGLMEHISLELLLDAM